MARRKTRNAQSEFDRVDNLPEDDSENSETVEETVVATNDSEAEYTASELLRLTSEITQGEVSRPFAAGALRNANIADGDKITRRRFLAAIENFREVRAF